MLADSALLVTTTHTCALMQSLTDQYTVHVLTSIQYMYSSNGLLAGALAIVQINTYTHTHWLVLQRVAYGYHKVEHLRLRIYSLHSTVL